MFRQAVASRPAAAAAGRVGTHYVSPKESPRYGCLGVAGATANRLGTAFPTSENPAVVVSSYWGLLGSSLFLLGSSLFQDGGNSLWAAVLRLI